MQAVSFALVAALIFMVGLVIAFAILASPLIAAAVFVVAFGAFLVWRGNRRAKHDIRSASGSSRIPSTREAAADPVEDSGVGVVAGRRRP